VKKSGYAIIYDGNYPEEIRFKMPIFNEFFPADPQHFTIMRANLELLEPEDWADYNKEVEFYEQISTMLFLQNTRHVVVVPLLAKIHRKKKGKRKSDS